MIRMYAEVNTISSFVAFLFENILLSLLISNRTFRTTFFKSLTLYGLIQMNLFIYSRVSNNHTGANRRTGWYSSIVLNKRTGVDFLALLHNTH